MTLRTIAPKATARLTLTEYAVLGLLGQLRREISGYDLKKLADNSIGYIWQPSKTQLYVVLRRLVDRSLATRRDVVQHGKPDKQLFRVTRAGRAAMRTWLNDEEDTGDPDRSILALKLFFGAQGNRTSLLRQLAAFRDAYATRLATYEAKLRDANIRDGITDEFTLQVLRYGIARARAAVEWADVALQELGP